MKTAKKIETTALAFVNESGCTEPDLAWLTYAYEMDSANSPNFPDFGTYELAVRAAVRRVIAESKAP